MDNEYPSHDHLIRELNELRQELSASKERLKVFQAIADYSPDGEFWIGLSGEVIWVNSMASVITGYTAEELINMPDFPAPLFTEDDKEIFQMHFQPAVRGSTGNNINLRIICKNAGHKWVSISWQPIFDRDGNKSGHRFSFRDITEQKLVEEELRITCASLTLSQEASQYGVWSKNFCDDTQEWSNELFRLFGLNPDMENPVFDTWHRILHPDDKETAARIIRESIEFKTDLKHEYRILLPTGEIRWIHGRGKTIYDDTDKPLRIIGICIDITDAMRKEEELRQYRDHLEQLVEKRTAELQQKTVDLEEINTTLSVLIHVRLKDKNEIEANTVANIDNIIETYFPILKAYALGKVQVHSPSLNEIISELELRLKDIASRFARRLSLNERRLTPKEIQVSTLIKEGKSTKEISEILNLSKRTIEFHRKNVRKKLDIYSKKANLKTFLMSLH